MKQLKTDSKHSFFSREINSFLMVGVLGLVISYIIYFWIPEYVHLIVEEDHLVENLSAFFYLTAGFLGLWAMKKNRNWKMLSLGVAVLGFIGFLDELSFGDRFFELNFPALLDWEVNSAHDLVAVGYLFFEDIFGLYGLIILVIGLVVTAGIALYLYQKKYSLTKIIGYTHKTLPGKYLILFCFFILAAILIDLKEHATSRAITEEMFELYAAVALCFYSIRLPKAKEIVSINQPQAAGKVKAESSPKAAAFDEPGNDFADFKARNS